MFSEIQLHESVMLDCKLQPLQLRAVEKLTHYFIITRANEFSLMFPDPRGEANKARGRLLAPPQISYERSSQQVSRGEWRMGNNDRFLGGASLASFAIVAVNVRNSRDIVDGFTGLFREASRRGEYSYASASVVSWKVTKTFFFLGMNIAALPRDPLSVIYNKQRNESVDIAFKRAIELAGNAYKSKPDVIFWLMPTKSEFEYAPFKACGKALLNSNDFDVRTSINFLPSLGVMYGIQTQAIVVSNLKKMSNNLQYQLK